MPPYRYQHFNLELMREDVALRPSPGPGELLPRFDMTATDGRRVRSEDYVGRQLFVSFASVT